MLLKAIDHRIRRAFSQAAIQYDLLTSLHKEIGRELIRKIIPIEENENILDVGMGTGWLTGKLAFYFPESKVIGLDFSTGMVDKAKQQKEGFDIIQANACVLPFQENTFDLIASNLAYQWIGDLDRAFEQCYSCLKPGGTLTLTMFGHDTFRELFESLEHASNGKRSFKRLAKEEQIKQALENAGFLEVETNYEIIKVHFPDMMSLMKWIKEIGANALEKESFIGKDLLKSANQYYNENFQDKFSIYATFEVIWAQARK